MSTSAADPAAAAALGAAPHRGSGDGEPALLSGWGRTSPTRATLHRPRDAAGAAAVLEAAGPRGAIARGLGRAYGDAAQNAGGAVVSTEALGGVREVDLARGVFRVGAGMSIAKLAQAALPLGFFPAVVPGTGHVSVGGAIACDIHGKNHHREGSFCAHVLAFSLLTPAGERLEVTREEEPEAFEATAGGMGLTGVVLEATLRLLPVETGQVSVDIERAADLDDLLGRMERGDDGYRYSVAWIDLIAGGRALGRSVLMRGDHAAAGAVAAGDGGRTAPSSYAPGRIVGAPPLVPPGLLSRPALRAFNEAYFRRAPREARGRLEPIHAFFHPLDGVRDWNRLYGPRGLLQHQLVVPFGAEDTLRWVVERLVAERAPAFLGVLKRFGPGHGALSFPRPGWTLAVDLPAGRPELAPLLDAFDERVAAAGGRIYLAKDARLRPELMPALYPELDRWRELRARLDPQGRMRSDLARRLGLAG